MALLNLTKNDYRITFYNTSINLSILKDYEV